jgi:polyisoprenoid-binding protein YceI
MTTALPTPLTGGTWTIDAAHSDVAFTVRHAGIAKVRGRATGFAGQITVGDDIEDSAVAVTIDATTVSTGDEARDTHLRTADFFEVDTYPEWTFTSTSVTPAGDDFVIAGDLTLHGVTRPVQLTAEFNGGAGDPMGQTRAGFSASTQISRKDFGLTWNAALETGGLLVSDNVKIELEVSAILAA